MVVYVVYGGAMRKWWCYAEVYVGTGTKFGEIWTENGAVDGDVAARGRMSGWKAGCPGLSGRMSGLWLGDEHEELRGGNSQLRTNWWMEKDGEGGES